MATTKDYLKLHFIVLLWGFTPIIGAALTLPAFEVVLFRTAIAAIGFAAMPYVLRLMRSTPYPESQPSLKTIAIIFAVGLIVGAHWLSFFAAIKIAGAAVGVIGVATSPLWVAIINPFFTGKKISLLEVALSLVVICGLGLIAHGDYSRLSGLFFSVFAGLLAAVFSIFNSRLIKTVSSRIISLYEMIGAFSICLLCLPVFILTGVIEGDVLKLPNGWADVVLLLVLSLVCTVYCYAECVELMRRVNVFIVNLSVNLEPVYGILLAVLLLGEKGLVNRDFIVGAALIFLSVFSYPLIKYSRWRGINLKQPFQQPPL